MCQAGCSIFNLVSGHWSKREYVVAVLIGLRDWAEDLGSVPAFFSDLLCSV